MDGRPGTQRLILSEILHVPLMDRGGLMGIELLPWVEGDEECYKVFEMTRDTCWNPRVFAEDDSLEDDDPTTAFINSVPAADSPAVPAPTTCAMVGSHHSPVPPAVPFVPLPFLVQAFDHFKGLCGVLWVFWEILHCFAFGWLSFPSPRRRINHTVKELEDGYIFDYLLDLDGFDDTPWPYDPGDAVESTLGKPINLVFCEEAVLSQASDEIMACLTHKELLSYKDYDGWSDGCPDVNFSLYPGDLSPDFPWSHHWSLQNKFQLLHLCDSFLAPCHPPEPSSEQTATLPWLCSFQANSSHLVSHHPTGQDDHLLPHASPCEGEV